MKAKDIEGHIAEVLKFAARLRQAAGKDPDIEKEARVIRVRKIAEALDNLRFAEDLPDDCKTLVDAICDDRWYLVIEAAELLQAECYLPRLCREKLVEDAKFIAYSLAQIEEPKLGKLEILRVIREVYPEVYAEIPSSTGDKTDWWKTIDPVPRANGGADRKREDAILALIARLTKSKADHFPEFMGPRYDPNWEGKDRFST